MSVIAMSKYGKRIELNPLETQRVIIQGVSGSGKSVYLNVIASAYFETLREKLDLRIIDPKVSGLQQLKPRANFYYNSPDQYLPALQEINTIIDMRYVEMGKMGKVKLGPDDYTKFKHILLIIDEFNTFINHPDLSKTQQAELKRCLMTISVRCRACGVSVILCGQQFQTSEIDSVSRAQYGTKIILQSASQTDVSLLYPEPEVCPAWMLKEAGTGYYIEKNGAQPVLIKTWYQDESEVFNLMSRYSEDKQINTDTWIVEKPE